MGVFQGVGREAMMLEVQQHGNLRARLEQLWAGSSSASLALRKQNLIWHFNALVQVALVAMFSACQPVILTFPLERTVFLREVSSGTYSVFPYYVSKVAVEAPLVFVQAFLTLSICHVMLCLNGDFLALLWTMVLLSMCSVVVALAVSAVVRHPRETGAIAPLVFVPQ